MRRNEDRLQRLCDTQDIINVQGRYMYYLESHRYPELLALFALNEQDVSVEIGEGGRYVGGDKVQTVFLDVLKPFFMLPGLMPLHMLTTPVVEISDDGRRAHGMWHTIGCNAFPVADERVAVWQQGYYDNRYVVADGRWKILSMRWVCNFRTRFGRGWVNEPLFALKPLDLGAMPPELLPNSESTRTQGYDPNGIRLEGPRAPEPGWK